MAGQWKRFDGTAWVGPIPQPPQVESCPATYDGPGKAWYHCLLPTGHDGRHRGGKGLKLAWRGSGRTSEVASC